MPNDRDKFEGRTYLYIKTHPLDDGTEPLPPGLEAWMSPDIVVIQPNGTRSLDAVADQQNQVEVTVTNAGGVDATNAYVDVFFSGPAIGFTPATAALVGGGFLNIPGYSRRHITVPCRRTRVTGAFSLGSALSFLPIHTGTGRSSTWWGTGTSHSAISRS